MKIEFKKSDYEKFSFENIEKILCVLEEIKKAEDLATVEDYRGEKVKVAKTTVPKLMSSCNTVWYEIEAILKRFQQEKIIKEFKDIQPFA